MDRSVRYRRLNLDGLDVFYREAGAADAPVLLLPHGYPCSSYEFRNYMPALADRWRLIAPDFPGCGYSGTPASGDFRYDFDGYAAFLDRFLARLGIGRFAIYLHDFGAYLRDRRPPTLILWGPRDGYMPEGAARAYLRDLPDAELHVLADAGHWLLETHLDEAVVLTRAFLSRVESLSLLKGLGAAEERERVASRHRHA